MTTISLEQLHELLRELQDNQLILTDAQHSYVVWVQTMLADGQPITQQHALTVKQIYHSMINNQFGG